MQKNGRDVSVFLKDAWNMEVLSCLCSRSTMKMGTWWKQLMSVIDSRTPINRVLTLCDLSWSGIDLKVLQRANDKGEYVYSQECLDMVKEAVSKNLDYNILLRYPSESEMRVKLQEMKVRGTAQIRGVLRRKV